MLDNPKVTVFIPAYNREKYIGDAIESILAQTFTNFEILLIDDGSKDRTIEIMRSYQDSRVRIIRNEHNLGIPKTRNKGIEQARGEFIAMLDSDDRAFPTRLEKQVNFLDAHHDFAQIGSWCRMMDEQGRPLKRIKRQPIYPEDVDIQLLFRCSLSNRSIMARTKILREYGYRNDYPRCQDYDLHVRLAQKYKLGNLPECLVYGRIHADQITSQTVELGDEKKRAIIRHQLNVLGVPFTEEDLGPHLTLSRMRKSQFTPDYDYLQWAENWLLNLQEANLQTHRYSQRAIAQAVREKWIRTCWAAWNGMGWKALKYYFHSPLRKSLGNTIRERVLT
ncbi:glycosyltransferase family 2 protein [Nitrospira sp. Ecomares 2.1]